MDVLSITSSYPRYEGDATAPFVESLTRALAARGHTIHVVLPESSEWGRPAVEGSIHFHPYRYSPRRSWTPWGYSASLERGVEIRKPLYALAPVVALSAVRTARRVLARNAIDVVQAHWVVPNGPIGAIAARGRAPLVVSLHGSDVAVSERSRAIGRGTRWAFQRAAAVTAPSRDLLDRAARLGAPELRERVPYGVDVARFDAAEGLRSTTRERLGLGADAFVVVGIGRLVPVKGFRYLIEACAAAAEQVPELRLLLVGDGDERDELERAAASAGFADRVVFTGASAPEEVPAYLSAADVGAVPSVRHEGYVDGLPNVALETMAAGKPLVATRVGGLPDLVRPGENGLLVEERDPKGLARALEALVADPALRARLGAAGRELVTTELGWDAVAERFESLFERVVARR